MLKIIHVEDNSDWLSTVRSLLEDAGHLVTGVRSVAQVRKHLKKVDVIICDGNIESDDAGDGFDLALKLQAQGYKVLVLADSRRDGQVPFLAKRNLDTDQLLKVIAQL